MTEKLKRNKKKIIVTAILIMMIILIANIITPFNIEKE